MKFNGQLQRLTDIRDLSGEWRAGNAQTGASWGTNSKAT